VIPRAAARFVRALSFSTACAVASGTATLESHGESTDAGVFLTAEVLGVKRAIFIKDEDGLYEDDPKKHPSAKHIARISAGDLLARNLPDLVVERVVVEYLTRSRFCKEAQIINGLKAGNITRALEGEDVGTIIHA